MTTTTKTVTLNRRHALGLAAGALLAAPKIVRAGEIAAGHDPAFAAIERHKAAAAAFAAFLECADGEGDEATYLCLDDAERHAMFALAGTTPTTRAGARAALAYLVREAGERHYRVLGIFAGRLIAAKWPAIEA